MGDLVTNGRDPGAVPAAVLNADLGNERLDGIVMGKAGQTRLKPPTSALDLYFDLLILDAEEPSQTIFI
jgi:hypothetical protein